jgi:4-carboxymuconolactone decarboxylase
LPTFEVGLPVSIDLARTIIIKFSCRNLCAQDIMPPIDRDKIHTAKAEEAHKTLFDEGIAIRRSVAGDSYVDASLAKSSTFSKPLQELVTEVGWGWIWSRPGLSRKQRSLLNLGMLCALNRSTELGVHVRGALRNGLSEEEIREALLQVGVYVGLPACKPWMCDLGNK